MREQLAFRLVFAVLGYLYGEIRQRHARRVAAEAGKVVVRKDPDSERVRLLNVLSSVGSYAGMAYIVAPPLMRWSSLPLPSSARWLGAAVGGASVALFYRAHDALGENWSGSLEIRHGHALITDGPYRWVRHPMYVAVCGWSLGSALLSANWLVGLTGLGAAALLASRIDEEEAMMLDAFGDEYRAYMASIPRFLPSIGF